MHLGNIFSADVSPKCNGCSILNKTLPEHCILDYENETRKEVLFLSDYPKLVEGSFSAFRIGELNVIMHEMNKLGYDPWADVGYSTSVKCPLAQAKDIGAKDRKICKAHLNDTIAHYRPKIVFVCGKLASTMVFGKAIKESNSRGIVYDYEANGFKTKICQIFHPWQVFSEPKNRYLFNLDIKQAIEYDVRGKEKKSAFEYDPVITYSDLDKYEDLFINQDFDMALDVETTGLNFLTDTVHTCALSVYEDYPNNKIASISIPIDHKEVFLSPADLREHRVDFIRRACKNKNRRVIMVNCKFDLKFLMTLDITEVYNVWDCKLMLHLINEDIPKSLASMVKYYCSDEL